MPFSLLDFVKGEGAAVSFIRGALEVGQSFTEALEAFRSAGGKIRTQTFNQVYNYFTGPVAQTRSYISYLGLNNLPTVNRLPKSLTNMTRNFLYEMKVEVINTETGEKSFKSYNVASDTLLSKQQAIDEISGRIEANPGGRYPFEFSQAQVTNVFQNGAGIKEDTSAFTPNPFASFTPQGVEAGITSAYNAALAELRAGNISPQEFARRTKGL